MSSINKIVRCNDTILQRWHGNRKYLRPIPNHHPCEDGCGILVASNRRFVSGHNPVWNKGLTKETDDRIAKYARKILGRLISKEAIERMIKTRKEKLASGEIIPPMKNKHHREESKQLMSAAKKGKPSKKKGLTKETDQSVMKQALSLIGKPSGMKGKHHKEESKEEIRKSLNKPETKKKISENSIKMWRNLESVKKIFEGRKLKPNNPEYLIDLITHEYWQGWKYTGDYSVMINGKNPDFVNKETKQIIEVYGDYWHDGEDPTDRAEIFAQAGYETCVIWENELKNLDKVILKIRQFINGPIEMSVEKRCQ